MVLDVRNTNQEEEMNNVQAFQGTRYNDELFKDIGGLITPPYDVIHEDLQERFYQEHPYNFIRLCLGKTLPEDTPIDNRYVRANQYLASWLHQNILSVDPGPGFYAYRQRFQVKDKTYSRFGIIALLEVQPFESGKILAHERTFSGPIEDRLLLMKETQSDLEPIFLLYNDSEKKSDELILPFLDRKNVVQSARDLENNENELGIIDEPEAISALQNILNEKMFYIADGHHRYTTALQYAQEEGSKIPGAKYVMAYLVNTYNEGMVILPTHRFLKKEIFFDLQALLPQIQEYFEVEKAGQIPSARAVEDNLRLKGEKVPSLAVLSGGELYYLTLRENADWKEWSEPGISEDRAMLDVSILHSLLIEKIGGLNIGEKEMKKVIDYERLIEKGLVNADNYSACFFMNPTKMEQVINIAGNRERMPQKSTFFYPKINDGIVFYSFQNAPGTENNIL